MLSDVKGRTSMLNYSTKTKIKKTLFERFLDLISLILLFLILLYIFINWSDMPDEIPMGYNSVGDVSKWGNKLSILGLPFLGLLAWVVFSLFEKFPQNINLKIYHNEDKTKELKYNRLTLNVIKNGVVLGLLFVNIKIIQSIL